VTFAISMISSRAASIRDRLVAVPLRTLVLAALCLSVGMVAAHLPLRWNGGRTAEVADIPLRPLSPVEAAALLTGAGDGKPLAGVVEIDEKAVVVRTAVYLLPSDVPSGECFSKISLQGVIYSVCSSSWEDYFNVHRVDRVSLESALGKTLGTADLNLGFLSESAASFASSRLPAYFATEVLFLTTLFTGMALGLRRLRNPLLIPPLLLSANVATAIFVVWYSPAFVDADWFYQRIALEEVIGGRGPFGLASSFVWVTMVPLTVVCLPFYALTLFVRGIHRLTGWSDRAVGLTTAGVVLSVFSIQFAVEYRRYVDEHQRATQAFEHLEEAITPRNVELIKADPALSTRESEFLASGKLSPAAASAANSMLAATPVSSELRLLIPTTDGWFVYLDANPHFRYGDVRKLKSENGGELIDYDVAESLVRTAEPYEASFWQFLKADYLAGRAFHSQGGTTVVALAGPGWTRTDAITFRSVWREVLGTMPW
jgi:hypothetical protein